MCEKENLMQMGNELAQMKQSSPERYEKISKYRRAIRTIQESYGMFKRKAALEAMMELAFEEFCGGEITGEEYQLIYNHVKEARKK